MCEAVLAERRSALESDAELTAFLDEVGIEFEPGTYECAVLAGEIYAQYRKNRGTSKRVLSDFLIAAHAGIYAEALIARDCGYYREYFKNLVVVDPSK